MNNGLTAIPRAGRVTDGIVPELEPPRAPLPWSENTNEMLVKLGENAWAELSSSNPHVANGALAWFRAGMPVPDVTGSLLADWSDRDVEELARRAVACWFDAQWEQLVLRVVSAVGRGIKARRGKSVRRGR